MEKRRGFTLIELLIVIAIIALLASLLFPVFARAQERGYLTQDLSQMRQAYMSVVLYEQDHDDESPTSLLYSKPYAGGAAIYRSFVDPYTKPFPGKTDYPADNCLHCTLRSPFRISYSYLYPIANEVGFDHNWFKSKRTDPAWGMIATILYNPLDSDLAAATEIGLPRVINNTHRIRMDGSYALANLKGWAGISPQCSVTPCFEPNPFGIPTTDR